MKKTINILTAVIMTLTFVLSTFSLSAFAWENTTASTNLGEYYDINNDGSISVADMVLARNAAVNDKLTANDLITLQQFILTGKMDVITFEEWDIDDYVASEENTEFISDLTKGVIVDCEIGEICPDSVRYRLLYDNKVTEVRCERIDSIIEPVKTFDFMGERVVLGITAEGYYAWDEDSFDLIPGEVDTLGPAYVRIDLDEFAVNSKNSAWISEIATKGTLMYLSIDPHDEFDSVTFRFVVDNLVAEFYSESIDEIIYPVAELIYEGEIIVVGVNNEGKYALDAYSFDIAPGYYA